MTTLQVPSDSGITLVNARLAQNLGSVHIRGTQIVGLNLRPAGGDRIIDVQGDWVMPGLINAHDHLQLNSLPSLGAYGRYLHVQDWISDINARRRTDPGFEASATVARDERLLIGGIKNLLSGVTTVAHHDPFYSYLSLRDYPTGVMTRYGWAHSLYMDGEAAVRRSYTNTPREFPWIIHAAEGVDDDAGDEFERLDSLGCIGANTLLVHGVALERNQRIRLHQNGAGLVWCPSSNLNLFGRTAEVIDLLECQRVALGTDSRLTGARDMLDELRLVGKVFGLDDSRLESLVTCESAQLLRLPDRGSLQSGSRADILILPAQTTLSCVTRADVRLVLLNGRVRYGDRCYAESLAPACEWVDVRVDGRAKVLDRHLAALLHASSLSEPGLELPRMDMHAA